MSTPFWFKDISILYNKNYLLEIIPKKEYDFSRKLNAVVSMLRKQQSFDQMVQNDNYV